MQASDVSRWERTKALFHEAVESAPERRAALVAASCGGDAPLRDEVLSLLASDNEVGDFIEQPAAALLAIGRVAGPGQRLHPGERLGRYEILAFLGAGAVSEVYRARDTRLGRTVALKLLTDGSVPYAGAWLLREAQHASTLNHPHICMVYEVDEVHGLPFIVLEHVDGITLHASVRQGLPSTEAIVHWGTQIADALDHAHLRGVIHRDLKGSNVLITPDNNVKVLDFGLARRLDPPAVGRTSAFSVLADASVAGTLTHIAPEVFQGGEVDARIDIWALGVMLYEMASGSVPFKGETTFSTASAILHDPPPPLSRTVPPALQRIIARCLSKDPAARYGTASEVRQALETAGDEHAAAARHRPRTRGRAAAALLVALLAGAAYVVNGWIDASTRADPEARILAVLPFQDASGDESQRFVVDGMTEAIIAELGRIDAVRVIAPRTTERFRGRADAVRNLARETRAAQVLEGRVTRATDSFRLAARLLDTSSGRVLWSAEYERHARDLHALYGAVAADVAEAIQVRLDEDDSRRLSLVRAVDPDVYEAYLKGRYYWNQRTSESLATAIGQFETSIALDPSYAPAYAALADCYNQLGTQMVGGGSPREWRPKAAEAAIRALQIDPALAEAHATLGYVRHYDWEWDAAEKSFRRALELNPSYALGRIWYANLLSSRGRSDEAIAQVTIAAELDPLSPVVATNVAWVLINARKYDEAIAELTRTIARDPAYVQAHSRLGAAYSFSGRHDEAIAALETAVRLTKGRPSDLAALAQGLGLAGRREEAERLVTGLIADLPRQYVPAGALANAYAALGRTDEALTWLERSHRERTNNNAYLSVEPVYDTLRGEPRFQALVRATGLP
jgi:serine/threonine-protein kinase